MSGLGARQLFLNMSRNSKAQFSANWICTAVEMKKLWVCLNVAGGRACFIWWLV